MSGDNSWLFLFSALGGIGGCATVVMLVLAEIRNRRRNMTPPDTSDQPRTPASRKVAKTPWKEGLVPISRTRLAVLGLLLLLTTSLSIAGFVSSVQRKEELNISLRPENIQTTIRGWLDSFGYGSTIATDPATEFSITVNMPASGKHVTILREKNFNRYIAIGFALIISAEDQALIAKLSENERTRLYLDMKIELDRAGADSTLISQGQITCVKRIPITNSLTEDVLIRTINSVEATEDLVFNALAKGLIR